jgi:hypothetical protein
LRRLAPQQRERAHHNRHRKAATARTLTRRAGPALPSYLALHHAGFSVPHALPRERWALTPPFHPYQRIVRRHLAGFPARCHRAVPRRSIFCGTFRERIALPRFAPLALPGALPLLPMTRDGVRTFLPLETSCDEPASDHPAHPLRTLYRERCPPPVGVWKRHPLPPVLLSKDVILGELHREIAQGCESKWVKFTEHPGRIANPIDFANLRIRRGNVAWP